MVNQNLAEDLGEVMEEKLQVPVDDFKADTERRIDEAAYRQLTCSFCGKKQDEVKHLIMGPSVCICNECVELSVDLVREKDPKFLNNFSCPLKLEREVFAEYAKTMNTAIDELRRLRGKEDVAVQK